MFTFAFPRIIFASPASGDGEGKDGTRPHIRTRRHPSAAESGNASLGAKSDEPAAETGTSACIAGIPQSQLLAQLQSTDVLIAERALEIIHEAFFTSLWRVAYQSLQSHDLAEEVVQDVFIHLWEHRQSLAIRGSLGVYLHVATRNNAYKQIRHVKVVERHAQDLGKASALGERSAMWPSPLGNPTAELAELEADRALLQVLEGLSERDRQILVLRWREGWSFEDIAQFLGMTSVAARTVILRQQRKLTVFLAQLRDELKDG